jgi:hypothetical protein
MKDHKKNLRPERPAGKGLRLKISQVNAMEMPRGMELFIVIKENRGEKK